MNGRTGRLLLAVATTATFTACSSNKGSHSSPTALQTAPSATVSSDALRAAALKMQSATGYRFAASVTTAGATTTASGEFQAPDRLHEAITPSTGSVVEVVFIAGKAYVKNPATGKWTQTAQTAASASAGDPRSAFAVLQQVTHVVANATGFEFDLPAGAAAKLVQAGSGKGPTGAHGRVVLSAQGIAHLEFNVSGTPSVTESLDYQDIGGAPSVTQPPLV